jgi:class 3 adenylate cyclase/tetratricopeptide (TPR) repeat protein
MRQERKVVTVLFADLVGFTSRAEAMDPEDVDAVLSRYHARVRHELERHGGTVEKFIGDAVMALFGAPTAHEDDPERAVRAALSVRDWAREQEELEVRIGVNTGEALVKLEARPEAGEGMAAGDVVNTAARLQAAASVNGVLVGEATYRATRRVIDYRDAEPVEAKGKAEPVAVWEAVEPRARRGVDVDQAGAPLVGRRNEVELLAGALARARSERTSQLVTLVGTPGIGKSRLVYELGDVVERDPEIVAWRQGRSLPYGEGVTYWALGEMVKAQAGILETDDGEQAEAKLDRAVGDLVPDDAEAQWVHARLKPLLGLGGGGDPGGDRRAESFSAWRRFLEALAESRPLVLVFEDLQWADDDLLDFIDYLVDWATGVPLLVVCTARPELLERCPTWGGGKPNAVTASLSPLSDDDTVRLIGQLLGRAVLPAETQAALLDRAGGNPLYAEQFARMLEERGELDEMPETVQGIIAARLDGLPLEEKALLQDAAVLGKVFWVGALPAIGGCPPFEAEERLHALERKEFVRRGRRSSVASEHEFVFRHQLVRDVAYGQIPRAERGAKHRAAAAWIESLGRLDDHAEMLAYHYFAALGLARAVHEETAELEPAARAALSHAGDRALALSAFPAARRFYESALELSPVDDPDRPALLVRYARSRQDDPQLDEALFEEAIEGFLQAGDRGAAAEAESLLAFVWWHRGEQDRALQHLESAVRRVAEEGPSRGKAYVLTQLSRLSMLAGEDARAIDVGLEGLQMAERFGLEELRARNLNTVGVSRIGLGQTEAGLADLERSVQVAGEINSSEQWQSALNLTWMHAMLGDVRRAWELHLESAAIAERFGIVTFLRWEEAERVYYTYWRGEWDDCVRRADEFVAKVAESGTTHYMESACLSVRACVRLGRGDAAGALADSDRAIELARRAKDPQALDPTLAVRARVLAEVGKRDEAARLLDELLVGWAERVYPTTAPLDTAWALRALDRGDELLPALARTRTQTRWFEAARLVAVGDLADAADELEQVGSVSDEMHARLQAAGQLAMQGRRAEADAQLARALAFYRSVAAIAYLREGEALLAAIA